ncbi:DNA-binding transcriptional regulator [Geothrix sp. PMB-07]|uniref:helix-turn-helix domain-containing protein n=1 Tax=Geothrix sp. PMB-07 TaxID=3068640 RepID=UPI0027413C94|nr:helix-turn-helix transcriptional regulator [Geothrix sp. PMB-07]WLT30900.1 helix-turn-helix transcriptional regulator [Geothrix sp. PMB-07]
MPNIASTLKSEILRLARKEVRQEVEGLKKASAQYRSDIAALKRRVEALEKVRARAEKHAVRSASKSIVTEGKTTVRFSAKGLASKRRKLGLSAAEVGVILGVSAQTVYNWEAGKSKPQARQLEAIAALRNMGKREIAAKLADSPSE